MPGGRKKSIDSRAIVVDGYNFYPTKQGYYAGSVGKKKIKRLHIYIWEKYYGAVPKGYHVHHIDEDKTNNDISNLALVNAHDHVSMHSSSAERVETAIRNMNEKARPKAIEWHKGDQGREWHKEHWKVSIAPSAEQKIKKICIMCGKEYETPKMCEKQSKFCSNRCKAAYRCRVKGGRTCAYNPYGARKKAESV